MATKTTTLELTKPASTETYAITTFNDNCDIIDDYATLMNTNIGEVENLTTTSHVVVGAINELVDEIGDVAAALDIINGEGI